MNHVTDFVRGTLRCESFAYIMKALIDVGLTDEEPFPDEMQKTTRNLVLYLTRNSTGEIPDIFERHI